MKDKNDISITDFINEFMRLKDIKIGRYDDFVKLLIKWYFEIAIKNDKIHSSKNNQLLADIEIVNRPRGKVYWTDFGINIGSEFNDYHWCVIIKEFKYTALVVPFSSKKEDDAEWKSPDNLIVGIGTISDLPFDNTRESYAMINQMRCMSKQRLSPYWKNGKTYDNIKLSNGQLDVIDNTILRMINCGDYIADTFGNDYY